MWASLAETAFSALLIQLLLEEYKWDYTCLILVPVEVLKNPPLISESAEEGMSLVYKLKLLWPSRQCCASCTSEEKVLVAVCPYQGHMGLGVPLGL